jgi:hypothetical protein
MNGEFCRVTSLQSGHLEGQVGDRRITSRPSLRGNNLRERMDRVASRQTADYYH